MKTLPLFLAQQAAAPAAAPGGAPQSVFSTQMVVLGLMLVGFYFLLIAPQRKKQKEHEKMLKTLGTGDEVVTSGGIYGVITSVKADRFVVRVADNTKIEVGKSFIQAAVKKTEEEKSK